MSKVNKYPEDELNNTMDTRNAYVFFIRMNTFEDRNYINSFILVFQMNGFPFLSMVHDHYKVKSLVDYLVSTDLGILGLVSKILPRS